MKEEVMGKLFLVSIGPGALDLIPPRAVSALQASEIIVGYQLYLDLILPLIEGKTLLSTPLGQEIMRVDLAIKNALDGKQVSLISSGDVGVYGLGGLALERINHIEQKFPVEIIPGITSATACASLMGAPLAHDFCVLSLSDILVPKKTIMKRAESAAVGGFVTALYNVQSAKRQGLIYEVLEIFKHHRTPDTPCGIVTNAYRKGEKSQVVAFEDLWDMTFDMLTTIIIGNEATLSKNGFLVTQRGYQLHNDGKE